MRWSPVLRRRCGRLPARRVRRHGDCYDVGIIVQGATGRIHAETDEVAERYVAGRAVVQTESRTTSSGVEIPDPDVIRPTDDRTTA
jgi:hypothetical protein